MATQVVNGGLNRHLRWLLLNRLTRLDTGTMKGEQKVKICPCSWVTMAAISHVSLRPGTAQTISFPRAFRAWIFYSAVDSREGRSQKSWEPLPAAGPAYFFPSWLKPPKAVKWWPMSMPLTHWTQILQRNPASIYDICFGSVVEFPLLWRRLSRQLTSWLAGGGIGVLAFDLGAFKKRGKTRKVPFPRWFRLRRAIEGTSTVLSVLEEEATAGSASSVVVSLQHESQWTRISSQGFCKKIGPSDLFRSIKIQAQLLRGKNHGHVTFYRHLQP